MFHGRMAIGLIGLAATVVVAGVSLMGHHAAPARRFPVVSVANRISATTSSPPGGVTQTSSSSAVASTAPSTTVASPTQSPTKDGGSGKDGHQHGHAKPHKGDH